MIIVIVVVLVVAVWRLLHLVLLALIFFFVLIIVVVHLGIAIVVLLITMVMRVVDIVRGESRYHHPISLISASCCSSFVHFFSSALPHKELKEEDHQGDGEEGGEDERDIMTKE